VRHATCCRLLQISRATDWSNKNLKKKIMDFLVEGDDGAYVTCLPASGAWVECALINAHFY
jgi:hypothetical protein